jgi:hypothetical protein
LPVKAWFMKALLMKALFRKAWALVERLARIQSMPAFDPKSFETAVPPGRAKFATKPPPIGSAARAKTMGMVRVYRSS